MTTAGAQTAHSERPLTRQALRTPRAAAIAGILFSVLFIASMSLLRLSLPEELDSESLTWLESSARSVRIALALVPFAGVAFLWFMGVVRDRLGQLEDQFFSTVFFGSGLLFLAMIFSSAAIAGGMIAAYQLDPETLAQSGVLTFGRTVIYMITNIYAIRMAGVFMISLATIWTRTRVMPRPFAILTYLLALTLLIVINLSLWMSLVFPTWVAAVSIYILFKTLRGGETKAV